jgi:hypothetical protein
MMHCQFEDLANMSIPLKKTLFGLSMRRPVTDVTITSQNNGAAEKNIENISASRKQASKQASRQQYGGGGEKDESM